ncbi:TetR/AcrR family transcriptional regulator [Nocardioides speluncae]|uniref:TetR/AcrR family transcriptional regulator n=1 Tax=Nocardioides speluncae TaxID=2670337 RepID=UPI001379A3DB|nr:TetR/AcrR family transcriptional regulator [Nocardioides speluncae]
MAVQQDEDRRTLELLWGQRRASSRGPQATLNVEKIALAAIKVADADGIDAVSMQRVAESLDFTKMSLYRHVAGKAELLAVMVEHAVGEPPDLRQVKGGWRPRVERWAASLSSTWDAHPWLPGVTAGSRVMGPREMAWSEEAVAALADTSLSAAERMDVVTLLSGHLRSTLTANVVGTQPWHEHGHIDLVREHRERFPSLYELGADRTRTPRQTRDFGLHCVLDGIENAISQR